MTRSEVSTANTTDTTGGRRSGTGRAKGRRPTLTSLVLAAMAIAPGSPLAGQDAEALDSLLASHYSVDGPGAVLMVLDGDSVVYRGARGRAAVPDGPPLEVDTPFYVASVGKIVTSALILRAARAGRLDLQAPVGSLLPDLPEWLGRVPVIDLLGHTGGVPDYYDLLGDDVRGMTNARVIETVVAQGALDFEPGSDWAYSNSGYVLLAEALEAAWGASFAELVRHRIADPLNLSSLRVHDRKGSRPPDAATGYQVNEEGTTVVDDYGSYTTGPGGLYASARELAWLVTALRDGTLITADDWTRATTMRPTATGRPTPYGLGWQVETWPDDHPYGDHVTVAAFGSLNGFRALVLRFDRPFGDRDVTVVALSNAGDIGWAWDVPVVMLLRRRAGAPPPARWTAPAAPGPSTPGAPPRP